MRPVGMSGSGVKTLGSKPNLGLGSKKPGGGAFAKPSFAMGAKKTVGGGAGPPVISKASINPMGGGAPKMNLGRRRQQEDDFIAQEMAQIQR